MTLQRYTVLVDSDFVVPRTDGRYYLAADVDAVLAARDAEMARLRNLLRWRRLGDEQPAEGQRVEMTRQPDDEDAYDIWIARYERGEWWVAGDDKWTDESDLWRPMPELPAARAFDAFAAERVAEAIKDLGYDLMGDDR